MGNRSNLTDVIKARMSGLTVQSTHKPSTNTTAQRNESFDLAKAVTSKVEDGNIRAALRLLCSDDKPTEPSDTVFNAMQARHPPAPPDRSTVPDPESFDSHEIMEATVSKAIKAFPAGSSGGPDGLRPQHLLELVTCQAHAV